MPRIIIHIDRGGDWNTTKWFFDHLRGQQVEYDIIGQSYYPFWHGTLDDLRHCLTNAAARYGKPVMVMETAFPWVTNSATPIVGIAPGKEGQVEFVAALAKVLQEVPEGRGMGIFWWGSEFLPMPGVNLAGFDGRSFFDREGNALPVIEALGRYAGQVGKPQ
jgi:arabinogalactan endo-1,4-beta-galactosidase